MTGVWRIGVELCDPSFWKPCGIFHSTSEASIGRIWPCSAHGEDTVLELLVQSRNRKEEPRPPKDTSVSHKQASFNFTLSIDNSITTTTMAPKAASKKSESLIAPPNLRHRNSCGRRTSLTTSSAMEAFNHKALRHNAYAAQDFCSAS